MFEARCPQCHGAFLIPANKTDAGIKWYRLAAVRPCCPSCKAELSLSKSSRQWSGAPIWIFLLAGLINLCIRDRSLRGDVMMAAVALMLLAKLVFLFSRSYVVAAKNG